jgi:hypothetical protein
MRTCILLALVLAITEARAIGDTLAEKQAAADVSMLAAWVCGAGDAKVFPKPFPSRESIADATDVMFYSDVARADLSKQLRRVSYDLVEPRLRALDRGKFSGKALSITRAIEADPEEGRNARQASTLRRPRHDERFYNIELIASEKSSNQMKVLLYEAGGQTHVGIISSGVDGTMQAMEIEPAVPPSDEEKAAADVSMLAAWVAGEGNAEIFAKPFGDRHFIGDAKDAILYTDVGQITVPKQLRRVSYQFIRARMDAVMSGNQASPGVLITRSTEQYADDGVLGDGAQAKEKKIPGARYYYIEVGIGNMAWHWIKVAVYEVNGKTKVEFLRSAVS